MGLYKHYCLGTRETLQYTVYLCPAALPTVRLSENDHEYLGKMSSFQQLTKLASALLSNFIFNN